MWKWIFPSDDDLGFYGQNNGIVSDNTFDNTATDTNWHDYSFRRVGTSLKLYRDNILKVTKTYNDLSTNTINVGFQVLDRVSGDNSDIRFDTLRVRNFTSPVVINLANAISDTPHFFSSLRYDSCS